jgi:anti-anti-sigma regulatory factor
LVTIDGPGEPDLATAEELARLRLLARRWGLAMRLTCVTPALCELLELCGLDGVVLVAGSVEEPR